MVINSFSQFTIIFNIIKHIQILILIFYFSNSHNIGISITYNKLFQ